MLMVTGAAESGLAMVNSAAQSAPAPAQSSARRAAPKFDLTVLMLTPPLEIDFWIGYDGNVRFGVRGGRATLVASLLIILLFSRRHAVGSIVRLPRCALDGLVAFCACAVPSRPRSNSCTTRAMWRRIAARAPGAS